MRTHWRTGYDPDEDTHRAKSDIHFTKGEGKTLQAPAEDADINVIMKRFGITDGSRLPNWQTPNDMYADFSNFETDPVEVQETLRQGKIAFERLPAAMRARFRDGPHLYNWLNDPANLEEAIQLKILTKRQPDKKDLPVSLNTSSVKEPTSENAPPAQTQEKK